MACGRIKQFNYYRLLVFHRLNFDLYSVKQRLEHSPILASVISIPNKSNVLLHKQVYEHTFAKLKVYNKKPRKMDLSLSVFENFFLPNGYAKMGEILLEIPLLCSCKPQKISDVLVISFGRYGRNTAAVSPNSLLKR